MQTLPNSVLQSDVSSEWKAVKPEVMKWFSMSNPSFNTGDTEQQTNNGFPNTGLQVSRKRAKLEIRRDEVQPLQLETAAVEIDSSFFNGSIGPVNGEVSLLGTTEPVVYPTDTWGDIVVKADNNQEVHFNNLETTQVNKTTQCTVFIEAKGRQCVRWANDGDIYC